MILFFLRLSLFGFLGLDGWGWDTEFFENIVYYLPVLICFV